MCEGGYYPYTIRGVNWRLEEAGDLVLRLEYSERSGVWGGFGSWNSFR